MKNLEDEIKSIVSMYERDNNNIDDWRDNHFELTNLKQYKYIYHYTTPEALKNIINRKELWMTHIQFFSDKREVNNVLEVINELIDDISKEKQEQYKDFYIKKEYFLKMMYEFFDIEDTYDVNVYCSSFSINDNSPYLWQNYSRSGYNIEFKCERLFKTLSDYNKIGNTNIEQKDKGFGFYSGEVVYKIDNKKQKIKHEVYYLFDIFNLLVDDGSIFMDYNNVTGQLNDFSKKTYTKNIFNKILTLAFFFKDEDYSNEEEFRIVLIDFDNSLNLHSSYIWEDKETKIKLLPIKIETRIKDKIYIPYSTFIFNDLSNIKAINSNMEYEDFRHSRFGLKHLLKSNNAENIEIYSCWKNYETNVFIENIYYESKYLYKKINLNCFKEIFNIEHDDLGEYLYNNIDNIKSLYEKSIKRRDALKLLNIEYLYRTAKNISDMDRNLVGFLENDSIYNKIKEEIAYYLKDIVERLLKFKDICVKLRKKINKEDNVTNSLCNLIKGIVFLINELKLNWNKIKTI